MTYTAWIIVTASLVGMSCGLIGVFLVLRKTAMMADAISHTVLLGIVLAFLVTKEVSGPAMLVGGIFAGLLTAFLVQWLHSLDVQHDASMGIIFTTLFAIGVILISTSIGNAHLDIQHALMGEITFIPFDKVSLPLVGEVPRATLLLFIVFLIVLFFITAFYKEWKITSFDSALAVSIGIPAIAMHYLFMSLVSITTVASFDAVGAIMVVAMLITPASSAYLWTDRLVVMLILSSIFGILSAISGYYIAYWIDTSISGSMAFSTGLIFMFSFIFSPKHGIISKYVQPIKNL
ncbi:manganese/zinc/iron transport system permease protein [Halolactibacillus halophilus]|uniref:Manganese transport system membrane protein MntD n=1 Tax=Halolactibacillus halophilus TaxID=306540 RepID=A0A1I5NP71_9BACI|nr:metal ABC transporter permease [Halolactibacillus halophilus]GEM01406.1 manganese transport system membrane protein MntD [Halolactibacillus halophilus]SFP23450.1 manganese/zinc/iron transport system permease protein [Halolactibacillus halophilus]